MQIPKEWTFKEKEIAEGFDIHVRETLPWYDLVTESVVHIGRHYIGHQGVVYDIGASTGNIGFALYPVLEERDAQLIGIDDSEEIVKFYKSSTRSNVIIADALEYDYKSFDFCVCFLTLMFLPVRARAQFVEKLRGLCNPGGAIVIVDKQEATSGYLATVLWRMTLAGKVKSGIAAEDIVAKELSLGGVQRPIRTEELGPDAHEFFRLGDFAGWVIEKK